MALTSEKIGSTNREPTDLSALAVEMGLLVLISTGRIRKAMGLS